MSVSLLDFMLRLVVALLCGALIGVERQVHQRYTAGLRTGALVASGSALFVLVAGLTPGDSSPLRIAPQIVTGVGFLCAGVIMRDGLHVRGLNTAGALWCACGIGILAGSGYYLPAVAGTLIVLGANLALRPLEYLISSRINLAAEAPTCYLLSVTVAPAQEAEIRSLLLQGLVGGPIGLQSLQSSKDATHPEQLDVIAHLQCQGRQDQALEQLVARLSMAEGVSGVYWQVGPAEEDEHPPKLTLSGGALEEREPSSRPPSAGK